MDTMAIVLFVGGVVLGALLGVAVAALVARARHAGLAGERDALRAERDRLREAGDRTDAARRKAENEAAAMQATLDVERRAAAEQAELVDRTMGERFRALSSEALEQSSKQFLQLADERLKEAQTRAAGDLDQRRQAVENMVAPLKETLTKVEGQLRELEQARVAAYHSLTEQVSLVRQTGEQLRHETASLANALRAPQVRGRWGELQLERIVELAGMSQHCDVTKQGHADTDDGQRRPDLVVHLAGGKNVVVDSKVPLVAYLEAMETTEDAARNKQLSRHAKHLRKHVDQLAAKEYWTAFSPAPEFVVLFVPGEAFLAPALEHDPQLLEHAMANRVVIATPTTLISMLRTIAYTWQQAVLTDNAREVFELGKQLYDRLGKLGDKVDSLGRAIGRVVTAYNGTVASLETRVLVSARRMRDLQLVEGELPGPSPVEETPRPLGASELVSSASEARQVHLLYDDEPAELTDDRYGVTPEQPTDESDQLAH